MKRLKLVIGTVFTLSILFCSAVLWNADINRDSTKTEISSAANVKYGEEPVIVIDAGHGGVDTGASGDDGTSEKDINLAIALELKKIIEEYPVKVVLTREDGEELLEGYDGSGGRKRFDMENRKKIIDSSMPTVTVSVHLNSFPADESVCGAQVFYPESQDKNTGEISERFADCVQKKLNDMNPQNGDKEPMTKNDIFLFKNIDTPIILVECGFLSNIEERNKLKTTEYQRTLAESVWAGLNENLALEKHESNEMVDSANKDKK